MARVTYLVSKSIIVSRILYLSYFGDICLLLLFGSCFANVIRAKSRPIRYTSIKTSGKQRFLLKFPRCTPSYLVIEIPCQCWLNYKTLIKPGNTLRGSITDLLFGRFRNVLCAGWTEHCIAQRHIFKPYSDTSPLSVPWSNQDVKTFASLSKL